MLNPPEIMPAADKQRESTNCASAERKRGRLKSVEVCEQCDCCHTVTSTWLSLFRRLPHGSLRCCLLHESSEGLDSDKSVDVDCGGTWSRWIYGAMMVVP